MVNRKMSSPVTIELYVKKCNKDNLKIEEHEAIKEYESLINMLPKMNRNVETNSDTRRKLEEGYRAYFRFFRE